ncbi:protein kinase, partial [Myxococcota bacterium]|nr:protein kinase [Myxococcota bacterium]
MSAPVERSRRLGAGGMAEVFLTRREGPGGLDKLVVIKRILPHVREDARFVQMFLGEARLAASLNHPNIVQIYDVYRDEADLAIVMEYLQGENLRVILKATRQENERVPLNIAGRILMDVAAALRYAHEARDPMGNPLGLIHRDVTLSNVIVGYNGVTKLLDFGIAKANTQGIYTRPGQIKGKYAYCSPEQIQHGDLDHRSDLFSLGVLMYELLTGRRLFKRDTPLLSLKAVMEAPIPSASKFNEAIPDELEALLLRLLVRKREKRLQSAAEFLRALEPILEHHGLLCSAHEVGEWMSDLLAQQRAARLKLEAEVRAAVGEGEGEAWGISVGASGSHSGGSYSGVGPGLTQSALSAMTPPPPSLMGAEPGSHSSALVYVNSPKRTGLIVAVSVLATLLVLGAVSFFFYLGRQGNEARPITPLPALTPPIAAKVALRVHVVPSGARLIVDGVTHPAEVGPEGLFVPATAGSEVRLEITREGYTPQARALIAPPSGIEDIYINLVRLEEAPDAALPVTSSAPVASAKPVTRAKPVASAKPKARHVEAPKRGHLQVTYTPPEARLSVDGQGYAGGSPQRLKGLTAGRHLIQLEAEGFQPLERSVEIEAEAWSKSRFEMKPVGRAVGALSVESQPSGATLTINGAERGKTPALDLELEPGRSYTVRLTLEGYAPWEKTTRVEAGAAPLLSATLRPLEAAKAA